MTLFRIKGAALIAALSSLAFTEHLMADVWVFEPSVSLDQRFDDNFFLIPEGGGSLSATRAVGELGVSREAEHYAIRGLARADARITTNTDVVNEELESNQLFSLDASRRTRRSRYGVRLSFVNDTPSRDIVADLSDESSVAQDTGQLVTQSLSANVARQEITIAPNFKYDVTRRLQFDADVSYTDVQHDLPSAQDAIFQRFIDTFPRDEDGSFIDELPSIDSVTIDDVGVFSPTGELDDFTEARAGLGLRFKLSPISTFTTSLAYSRFVAQVEPPPEVFFNEFQLIPDDEERQIVRRPRRDQISTTTSLSFGYERFVTPLLQFSVDAGVFTNTLDDTDTFRAGDVVLEGVPEPEVGKNDTVGFLASTSVTYDTGITRLTARLSADVQPSSSGSEVESNEFTAQADRVLSPRLNVSLRARAFQPNRLGTSEEDRFARRFFSLEPRVQWQYTRYIALSAAYRYRRQRADTDPSAAESNALLFAITYTPASKVRDLARGL